MSLLSAILEAATAGRQLSWEFDGVSGSVILTAEWVELGESRLVTPVIEVPLWRNKLVDGRPVAIMSDGHIELEQEPVYLTDITGRHVLDEHGHAVQATRQEQGEPRWLLDGPRAIERTLIIMMDATSGSVERWIDSLAVGDHNGQSRVGTLQDDDAAGVVDQAKLEDDAGDAGDQAELEDEARKAEEDLDDALRRQAGEEE